MMKIWSGGWKEERLFLTPGSLNVVSCVTNDLNVISCCETQRIQFSRLGAIFLPHHFLAAWNKSLHQPMGFGLSGSMMIKIQDAHDDHGDHDDHVQGDTTTDKQDQQTNRDYEDQDSGSPHWGCPQRVWGRTEFVRIRRLARLSSVGVRPSSKNWILTCTV